MLLFAVVLSPLMFYLERRLQGLALANACLKVSAYADDAFFVLRCAEEVQTANQAFRIFGAGSGLAVNPQKSGALAVGRWDRGVELGYPYVERMKVLGILFTKDITTTSSLNWPEVLHAAKGVLSANIGRCLSLEQRVQFVNSYAFSKLWHAAQVLPIPKGAIKEANQAAYRFLWRGFTFKLTMEATFLSRAEGGIGAFDVGTKANSMFTGRWQGILATDEDSFSAEWLQTLLGAFPVGNPPNTRAVWAAARHYGALLTIRAYAATPEPRGDLRGSLLEMKRVLTASRAPAAPRVARKNPGENWSRLVTACTRSTAPTRGSARRAGRRTCCCTGSWSAAAPRTPGPG